MYSEFLKSLPMNSKSFENFLVKGLKVAECELDTTLARAIGNYFIKKENLVVFTSPFQGKLEALEEITNKILTKFAVITNIDQLDLVSKKIKGPVFSNLTFELSPLYEHLIFYNTEVLFAEHVHISCFYDFIGLYDTSLFKNQINLRLEYFPENFIFTTVCKYPTKKSVEFIFGTADNIKHLAIKPHKNTILYHSKELFPLVTDHLKENSLISTIPDCIRCERFVFYDFNLTALPSIIEQVDYVVILYTQKDFVLLSETVKVLQSKGLDIPSSILKIIESDV